jgi:arylsulfatase A-like enzyme
LTGRQYVADLTSADGRLLVTWRAILREGSSYLRQEVTIRAGKEEYLYFEYPEKGGQIAVRMGDWRGVRVDVRKNREAPWQIYNLKSDVGETTDLAAQHPELVSRFEAIQKKEHWHAPIQEWEFIDPKFNAKH